MVVHAVYLYDAVSGCPLLTKTYDRIYIHPVLACGFFHALPTVSTEFLKEPVSVIEGKKRKLLLCYDRREIDYREYVIEERALKTYENKKKIQLGMAAVFDKDDNAKQCKEFSQKVLDGFMHACTRDLMEWSPSPAYESYLPQLEGLRKEFDAAVLKTMQGLEEQLIKLSWIPENKRYGNG